MEVENYLKWKVTIGDTPIFHEKPMIMGERVYSSFQTLLIN